MLSLSPLCSRRIHHLVLDVKAFRLRQHSIVRHRHRFRDYPKSNRAVAWLVCSQKLSASEKASTGASTLYLIVDDLRSQLECDRCGAVLRASGEFQPLVLKPPLRPSALCQLLQLVGLLFHAQPLYTRATLVHFPTPRTLQVGWVYTRSRRRAAFPSPLWFPVSSQSIHPIIRLAAEVHYSKDLKRVFTKAVHKAVREPLYTTAPDRS